MSLEKILTTENISVISAKLPQLEHPITYNTEDKSSEILGYLGHHLSLHLTSNSGIIKTLFLKTYPQRDLLGADFVNSTGLFQREIDIYSIIFEDYQKYLNLDQLSWCPKFYFSKPKVIVIEDLDEHGYKMPESKACLNVDQAMGVIKAMVDFHGSSLLFEEKTGWKIPEKYPEIVKELLYPDDIDINLSTKKWIEKCLYELVVGVDHLDKFSLGEKEIIKRKLPEIIWAIYPLNKPNERFRNVIIHGDLWANNIMLTDLHEAKLVDYQFARWAPPAYDFMNLIYLTCSKQTRNDFEEKFKEHYYDLLEKQFKNYNLEVKNVLSWRDFLTSCEEYRHLALIQALVSLHYVLAPIDEEHIYEAEDKRDVKQYMQAYFKHEAYRTRITDIFVELVETSIVSAKQ